uniref:Uncharacterized protein n=1 Tax=Quercus lobata TaxID=97700 RepID=A0A7N2LXY3_QUELO
MEGASMVRIDRKSSIESEPRTLDFDQIQYAREAALYVLNTRTIEEAMTIFMKGLEPVVSTARHNESTMIDTEDLARVYRRPTKITSWAEGYSISTFLVIS